MTKGECASASFVAITSVWFFPTLRVLLSSPTLRALLLDHPQRSSTGHSTSLRV
jgi:hypothetical protein